MLPLFLRLFRLPLLPLPASQLLHCTFRCRENFILGNFSPVFVSHFHFHSLPGVNFLVPNAKAFPSPRIFLIFRCKRLGNGTQQQRCFSGVAMACKWVRERCQVACGSAHAHWSENADFAAGVAVGLKIFPCCGKQKQRTKGQRRIMAVGLLTPTHPLWPSPLLAFRLALSSLSSQRRWQRRRCRRATKFACAQKSG